MKENTVRKDILLMISGFTLFGFFAGFVLGILAWILHGLFTGFFRPSLALFVDAGILYAVLGFLLGAGYVGLTRLDKVLKLKTVAYVWSFFALGGTIWLAIEYENILALMHAFEDRLYRDHPAGVYIFNFIMLGIGIYLTRMQYRRGQKREAVLWFIFLGLWGLVLVLAILSSTFK